MVWIAIFQRSSRRIHLPYSWLNHHIGDENNNINVNIITDKLPYFLGMKTSSSRRRLLQRHASSSSSKTRQGCQSNRHKANLLAQGHDSHIMIVKVGTPYTPEQDGFCRYGALALLPVPVRDVRTVGRYTTSCFNPIKTNTLKKLHFVIL